MPIVEQSVDAPPVLATSNEPKVPSTKGKGKGSVGEQALTDAIVVVVGCWVLIFLMAWSLRASNI